MGILQDYARFRNDVGEKMFAGIEQYLQQNKGLLLSDIMYNENVWKDFENYYKGVESMKRYLVIDEYQDNEFIDVLETRTAANNAAEKLWNGMTTAEKKTHHVYVLDVTEDDLADYAFDEDGNINWTCYESGGYESDLFDSEKGVENMERKLTDE